MKPSDIRHEDDLGGRALAQVYALLIRLAEEQQQAQHRPAQDAASQAQGNG